MALVGEIHSELQGDEADGAAQVLLHNDLGRRVDQDGPPRAELRAACWLPSAEMKA